VHLRREERVVLSCARLIWSCVSVCYTCVLCYADRMLDRQRMQRFAVLHVSMGGVGLPCP
jgi:hypothetical protein